MSQHQVALALGRSQSFVCKCETGERRVDFVEAEMLAEIYGKPIAYFATREEKGNR